MDPISLEFSIVPDHPRVLTEPVVALGDFEAQHVGAVVYRRSPATSAVSSLWCDIILGRPLSTRLVLRSVQSLEDLFCLALFMDREFALNPKVPTLISAVELVTALSYVGLAHIDPDLARFLLFLDAHVFGGSSNRKDFAKRLQQALTWIREYTLEGTLPSLPRRAEPPRVLDHGTNGFVLAEVQQGKILEGLVDIYRLGFLRGVLFSPAKEGLDVLAFKKSDYLQFDLETACTRLNQAEQGVGRPPAWALTGLHLRNRSTLMPKDLITQVFLRV